MLYLENFGNPRHFTKIAREISRFKPIVAVKAGRTTQGAAAASSHTGALAELDVGVDALFDQCGVLRVSSVEELFDVARALASQPIPKGNRIAIVSNAGGPGLLATDALISLGMKLPQYRGETKTRLKKALSSGGSTVNNPLDLVAGAGGESFKLALNILKKDPDFDSIFTIFVPPVTINQLEVARSIEEGIKGTDKTVLACFMGAGEGSRGVDYLKQIGIPVYQFPEAIAKTLSLIDAYRQWLNRPRGKFRTFKVNKEAVQDIVDKAVKKGQEAIVGEEAMDILEHYGIKAAKSHLASSEKAAVQAADEIGYPVVMKVTIPQILHKTDFGAVEVDIRNAKEVRSVFSRLRKKTSDKKLKKGEKFTVEIQEMITGGIETVIGMTTDPSFGPLIMFGLGGIYVEILKDVAFRINPLNEGNADEMIKSLKSYPLLTGARGSASVDLATLKESLLRLSQLVSDFDIFSEIDINPYIAHPKKGQSKAVDARFIIKQS